MKRGTIVEFAAKMAYILPESLKKRLYRLGPVTDSLRSALNRAVPEGLTVVEIAGGELHGTRMELDLKNEKDYWLGTYEIELQNAARKFIQSGWTVYDLGANIGYLSLLFARIVGSQGKVIAIEALPENVERLNHNVSINGLQNQVAVLACAISDTNELVTFMIGPSGGMGKVAGSAGRDIEYYRSITVPGVFLDDLIFQQQYPLPQVIKMDIEGGEVLALPSMRRTLVEARPLMFLELHGEAAAKSAWIELVQANYTIHSLDPGYPQVINLDALNWKAYILAIPQELG